jgi:membrane protease YdiL (CAAX protease family)
MAEFSHEAVLIALLVWLLLMILAGTICVWTWVIGRLLTGRPILPEQPLVSAVRASWGAGSVLLVILLYAVVSMLFQWGYMRATGRLPAKPSAAQRDGAVNVANSTLTSKDKTTATRDVADSAKTTKPFDGKSKDHKQSLPVETEGMFLLSVVNSLFVVLIPLIVRFTSGARLRDLGICLDGWMRQAFVGVAATLFVVPIIYLFQQEVVVRIWPPDPSNDHPLKKMLEDQFTPGVVFLAIVSAVVLAPIQEELLYRAVVQGWLSAWLTRRRNARQRRPRNPSVPFQPLSDAGLAANHWEIDAGSAKNGSEKPPIPSDPTVDHTHQIPSLAVVLTSLFFASLHLPQWPAPIGIFLLSLAMGTVFLRTGSLIAAIFMHATFNGLSTIVLIGAMLASHAAEKKKMPLKVMIEGGDPVALDRHWVIDANGKQ